MWLRRIVLAVNVIIGLLVVVALGAAWWFLGRPTPKTSGTLSAPVGSAVTIQRDARGVPHIRAQSLEDAFFAQGFVTAQDRLWQMDSLRRYAAGELSEIIGKRTLELDMNSRKLRMRRLAEAHARSLQGQERLALAAYARGVNHYIETHHGRWGPEFALLQYSPRPWTPTDTLLAGLLMYRNLTTTWEDDLLRQKMIDGGNAEMVRYLFPLRTGNEVHLGSNAWAMSGKWTASGKPLLANDPHLEFSLPSTWYLIDIAAPGLHVAGASLPGVPAVIIGHNEQIAWGVTNLHYDVQDLYYEQIDLRTGRYAFKGQLMQAQREPEVIAVKGERPVEAVNWVTVHGPVFTNDGKRNLSLRWVAAEVGGFDFPFVSLAQAKNFDEFRAALKRFPGPAQNFIYADTSGNIGYQATGRLPIRTNYSGDVPVEGVNGEFEWNGFIPFEDLPTAYNPPSGILVTANQNPFPAGSYKYPVQGHFAAHYRSTQIDALLRQKQGWKAEDLLAVQKDVYSSVMHFLAQEVTGAVERRQATNQNVRDAVALLKNWNGQMEKGTPQPLIATLLFQHLRRMAAEKASPKEGARYSDQMGPAVIEKLLREKPKAWFPDYDKLLIDALTEAVDEGMRMQGRTVSKWDYSRFLYLELPHPVLSNIPVVGRNFGIGPVAMSGAPTTVKQTTRRMGPSMRMVADLSNWDATLHNITIGQSGHVFSSHYKDQWEAYYTGRSFPFPFNKVEGKGTLTLRPR